MGKRILIGSIIAVVIILLSSFSSVVGKVSSDDDLVEFDVEFCGLGKKHTVRLTQQEADEVELLFDEIEQRVSKVETRDEAEEIFKDAVVELDKYGLLGILSIKQAQQLIVESTVRQNLLKRIDGKDVESLDDETENYFCLIVGHLSHMVSQNPLVRRFGIFMEKLLEFALETDIFVLFEAIYQLYILIQTFSFIYIDLLLPFSFFRALSAGLHGFSPATTEEWWHPAKGWVHSFGLNGVKSWEGDLWGVASGYLIYGFFVHFYPAILGFTGIKLTNEDYETYFLGFALKAAFSNERP